MKPAVLLRARCILPISSPPIDGGAVLISGSRIAAVGRRRDLTTHSDPPEIDLGDAVILPGLINAHCHLDYTGMAGQLSRPKNFPDWIKGLLALKAQWTYSDYAESWLRGARMLVHSGVTTVADIEAVPELLPDVWSGTPLRVFSFLEMTGVKSRRSVQEILGEAVEFIDALAQRNRTGLSPHAPYSTSPELLHSAAWAARARHWPITTHVAESRAEFEMYVSRRGPLFDWLKNQRDMSDCGLGSPVQHLEKCGLLSDGLLAAHVNYLGPGDADLLGRRGVHVVHCPRSHQYFQHDPFPRVELEKAGVNVCLGTDSLVSVRGARRQQLALDMFAEMRAFASSAPDLAPETILKMATTQGARALGLEDKAGKLATDSYADLIAVPFASDLRDPADAILRHTGAVSAVMIDGKWAIPPATISS